jgi:hypothetical protein
LGQNLQLAIIRVGVDLKLFEMLASNKSPMTVERLAQRTGADMVLLGESSKNLEPLADTNSIGR